MAGKGNEEDEMEMEGIRGYGSKLVNGVEEVYVLLL